MISRIRIDPSPVGTMILLDRYDRQDKDILDRIHPGPVRAWPGPNRYDRYD